MRLRDGHWRAPPRWLRWTLVASLPAVIAAGWLAFDSGTAWQSVGGLVFSPDGKQLAIGVYAGRFRRSHDRWYIADPECTIALATIGDGRTPAVIDRSDAEGIVNMRPEVLVGAPVAFSSDGKVLASAGLDGTFKLWDAASRQLLDKHAIEQDHIRLLASLPGRNEVVAAFRYWIWFWDLGRDSCVPHDLTVSVQSLAISPDGSRLAVAGLGPFCIEIWDARVEKRLQIIERKDPFEQRIKAMVFAPDGKTLIAATEQRIEIFDIASKRRVAVLPERMVLALAISPDGHELASGRFDGVTLWDLAARRKRSFYPQSGAVESVQFSPDGRSIAWGMNDGSVQVRDAATADLKAVWRIPSGVRFRIPVFLKAAVLATSAAGLWACVRYFRARRSGQFLNTNTRWTGNPGDP